MAAKKKEENAEVNPDPLIITESQLAALTEEERNAFRTAGGTVTPDPQ